MEGSAEALPPGQSPTNYHGQIKSTAALAFQRVFITSWDHRLYCFDAGDGTTLWSFKTGHVAMSSPSVDPVARKVYFGSHDHNVYALDIDSGRELWRFETLAQVYGSPTIVPRSDGNGNVIIIGSTDQRIYMLNEITGRAEWQELLDGKVTSVPLVSDGRLYVSTDGGDLVCWE
jgi:outer membrane protein assembly factor BamB